MKPYRYCLGIKDGITRLYLTIALINMYPLRADMENLNTTFYEDYTHKVKRKSL